MLTQEQGNKHRLIDYYSIELNSVARAYQGYLKTTDTAANLGEASAE